MNSSKIGQVLTHPNPLARRVAIKIRFGSELFCELHWEVPPSPLQPLLTIGSSLAASASIVIGVWQPQKSLTHIGSNSG
ncbi:hypothetical protein JHK86_004824 [Glycine max]|nr:hypothetical protein JHK86_004824 [Glycine max]